MTAALSKTKLATKSTGDGDVAKVPSKIPAKEAIVAIGPPLNAGFLLHHIGLNTWNTMLGGSAC